MTSIIIQQTILLLARLILSSGIFDKILSVVGEWADKKISGAEKRQGVLDQLEVMGLQLSKSTTNLAIELAVQFLNTKVKK